MVPRSAAESTVRLVSQTDRGTPSNEGEYYTTSSPDEKGSIIAEARDASPAFSADRVSVVSELVSSYYGDTETLYERPRYDGSGNSVYGHGLLNGESTRSRIQLCGEPKPVRTPPQVNADRTGFNTRQPQLSWFLTLVVLTVVTVVCHSRSCYISIT